MVNYDGNGSQRVLKRIRGMIVFFIVALLLSGITAFPLELELKLAAKIIDQIGDDVA